MRTCTKREVTQAELDKFVKEYPEPLTFDGMRWTHKVPMGRNGKTTTVWNRPLAYKDHDGRLYLIEDK